MHYEFIFNKGVIFKYTCVNAYEYVKHLWKISSVPSKLKCDKKVVKHMQKSVNTKIMPLREMSGGREGVAYLVFTAW